MGILYNDFANGNEDAFKKFFESFYTCLCQITNRYLNDIDASRDIAQDAFIYLWEKRAEIYSVQSAKLYLYKYAKNRSLNCIRDSRRRSKILEEFQKTETAFNYELIEFETYQKIYKSIANLTPQEQRVIEHAMDGFTNIQVAEKLNISINTVKTLKKRAYKTLYDELKNEYKTRDFIQFLYFILFV